MNHEFTPRIKELCGLIAEEKDQNKFLQLVEELNELVAEKEQMLKKKTATD
ncbi:MAG: hypothetical protein JWO91_2481 [Acidobacteriaceae bacterium]|nr:hypothetical protein [Acidobacteriaceae bacterium]